MKSNQDDVSEKAQKPWNGRNRTKSIKTKLNKTTGR